MSPSLSIVSIPLALIAVASFAVRHQDHSFQTSPRTAEIQTPVPLPVPVRILPGSGAQIPVERLPVSQQPLYGRYGFDDSVVAGTQLGRDSLPRGLGERSTAPPD